MNKQEQLNKLLHEAFGFTAAEDERNLLPQFFTQTRNYLEFLSGSYDIVLGLKGSGKSAMLLFTYHEWVERRVLQDKFLILANSVSGTPVFEETLRDTEEADEYKALLAWRSYLLSVLSGELPEEVFRKSRTLKEWQSELRKLGLWFSKGDELRKRWDTVISRLNGLRRIKARSDLGFTPTGGVTGGGVEFEAEFSDDPSLRNFPKASELYRLMEMADKGFGEANIEVWILMDRLDLIYHDDPKVEKIIMRSLLETYRTMRHFKNMKLKVFLRSDLFEDATAEGFRNLDHLYPSITKIYWDSDGLMRLIQKRVDQVLGSEIRFLPENMGRGPAWSWIYNRLTLFPEGEESVSPRDVIVFLNMAINKEMSYAQENNTLLSPKSLKEAFPEFSKWRLQMAYSEVRGLQEILNEISKRGLRSKVKRAKMEEIFGSGFVNRELRILKRAGALKELREGQYDYQFAEVFARALELLRPDRRTEG
ncbi:MAG: hypothetical protein ABIM74_08110 [candidate division WOR-3 bacterium]